MSPRNGKGSGSAGWRSRFTASRWPSRWFTPTSGRRRRCEMPLATVRPTRSEPTSPGPRVTAMPPTCPRSAPARARAASITGRRLRMWWREASSGTTPPYGPCTASCEDTTEAASSPSRSTAAAESSHELSIPRTITLARRLHCEEDRVVAAPHEEEEALALAAGLERLLVGVRVLHRLAVHLEDHVAAPQARIRRRPARFDLGDDHSLQVPVDAQVLGQVGGERLHGEAQVLGRAGGALRGLLFLVLLDLDAAVLRPLTPDRRQLDRLADPRAAPQERQLCRVAHRLAVVLDDHVALLDAGGLGRAVLHHVGHQRPLGLGEPEDRKS